MYARIGDYFSIPARGIAHGEISHGINKACFDYLQKDNAGCISKLLGTIIHQLKYSIYQLSLSKEAASLSQLFALKWSSSYPCTKMNNGIRTQKIHTKIQDNMVPFISFYLRQGYCFFHVYHNKQDVKHQFPKSVQRTWDNKLTTQQQVLFFPHSPKMSKN